MATLYYNAAVDTDWNNPSNWWTDLACTISGTVPASGDNAVALSNVESNTGSTPTLTNFTGDGSYAIKINLNVNNLATFNNGYQFSEFSTNSGLLVGNCLFDYGANYGSISGNCTFKSSSNHFNITGNCLFENNSIASRFGTINGSGIFVNNAVCDGTVNGNCVFSSTSYFGVSSEGSHVINGNAIFNDSLAQRGTINGDVIFNGTSASLGDLTINPTTQDPSGVIYNDYSWHRGSSSYATFNDNSYVDGGFGTDGNITSSAVLNDYSNNKGTIANATFNHASYNTFWGDVTNVSIFNDISYNLGTVNTSYSTAGTREPWPIKRGINGSSILGVV